MNLRLLVSDYRIGVFLAVLSAAACSDNSGGTTTPSGPSSTSNNSMSSLTWSITDGCRDSRGLQIRFFDQTNGGVWPNASEVYVIPSAETRERTLSCRTGANICFGARTDPQTTNYWGVDLDNSKGCEGCCNTCRDTTVTRNLTCG